MMWPVSDSVRNPNILQTPECFPVLWNYQDDKITFHRLTPEVFRSTVFLGDTNLIRRQPFVGSASIGDLLAPSAMREKNRAARHYIFHVAYCCSTLLARYFEECQSHLVLKEPAILSNYAVKPQGNPSLDELRLNTISWLLGRTYPDQDVVVIKPNVPVNTIAKEILCFDSSATATFVVHGLEASIISILKYQWRIDRVRAWNKIIYRKAYERGEFALKPDFFDGVQTAAFWWIENMRLAFEFEKHNSDRALIVTADSIAEQPEVVLARIAELPGMKKIQERISKMISGNVASYYSKRSEKKYDIHDRKRETDRLLGIYSNEILRAREWLVERYGSAVTNAEAVR